MREGRALTEHILAIDTSTRASIVVLGDDTVRAVSRRATAHRHGSHVLDQIDEVLEAADAGLEDVIAVVVGTGPGSFTGLRVGLATAKTLAYTRSLPLVGLRSSDALRRAAVDAADAPADLAIVLPAGARDHYLARADEEPVLVPPDGLSATLGRQPCLTIDLDPEVLGAEASRLGEAALEGLPAALLALGHERLAAGKVDDVAELVPAYVALPRGIRHAAEELGWSPDLR